MAKNKLGDLRDHLFETLERLKDPDKPMEIERAKAIAEVAQTAINLAKVEVEMVRAADGRAVTGAFFDVPEEDRALPPASDGRGIRSGAGPVKSPREITSGQPQMRSAK